MRFCMDIFRPFLSCTLYHACAVAVLGLARERGREGEGRGEEGSLVPRLFKKRAWEGGGREEGGEGGGVKRGERKERGREGGTCRKEERSHQYRIWMMYGSYRGVASSKEPVTCQTSPLLSPQIYKCDNERCPRPDCYRSCSSNKEDVFKCDRPKCDGYFRLLR